MKTFVLAIALVFYGLVCTAQTGKDFTARPYIEVAGTAEMEVIPDEIYVRVMLDEAEGKAKQTVEEREKEMIACLKKVGIDVEKDVSVRDAASSLRQHWLKGATGQVKKEYIVLVRDGKLLGEMGRRLADAGVTNMSVDRVSHSKQEAMKQEVKMMAVKAAKQKAEILAGAIGQRIGKAIYINEQEDRYMDARYMPRIANVMMKSSAGDMSGEAEVEFEKIILKSTITVRFDLY